MFEHTNDKNWQESRQAAWVNEDLKESDLECTRTQLKAYRNYFLSGDIGGLVKAFRGKKQLLLISEIMKFGPFVKKEEFDHNLEFYLAEYAAEKLEQNILWYDLSNLEGAFTRFLIHLNFELHDPFVGSPFASSMVDLMFGDHFEPVVNYPTEFSVFGNVQFSNNPDVLFHNFNHKFRQYLARKPAHESHVAYMTRLPYYLSLFPHLGTSPFSLRELDDDDFENVVMEARPSSIQFIFRALLANLHGYKHDYDDDEPKDFGFNDPKFRDELRQAIKSLNLGKPYDDLVDMIHRHKGKIDEVFE